MERVIEGYENYTISTAGVVRNVVTGRILKLDETNGGYLQVRLYRCGSVKSFLVHRLVCEAFIQNMHNKPHVNHIDSNKKNNALANLEWCTPRENIQHATTNGSMKHSFRRGEARPNTKLTDKEVIFIKHYLFTKQLKSAELVMLFGVDRATIRAINKGRNWAWLEAAGGCTAGIRRVS